MRSSPKRSDDTSHRWNENHHSEVTYSENSTMQQKHHSNSYDMRETARGAQNSVKDDTKYVIENQVRFKYEYQSVFFWFADPGSVILGYHHPTHIWQYNIIAVI